MSPLQILVLEDDPDSAEAMQLLLQLEGYEVQWASCGARAVDLFREASARGAAPDILILDLMIPDMETTALVAALKRAGPLPAVVIHSAGSEDQVREAAEEIGAVAAIRKPTDWPCMLEALRSAVARVQVA